MPRAERPDPPFVRITDSLRDQIHDGTLRPGDKLPSIKDMAKQWGVATATVAKAITRLQVERAVWSGPQGTFVSGEERISRTPGERIRAARPARPGPGADEEIRVTAAEIVTAPDYVAGLLQIDPGSQVIRREEITTRRGRARMLAVDWIPAGNVMLGSELLAAKPLDGGPERVITTVTGRHITHAQDHLEARGAGSRAAGSRESDALGIKPGTPILAGAHVWSDDAGPVLYGEWILPPDVAVSYFYEVTG